MRAENFYNRHDPFLRPRPGFLFLDPPPFGLIIIFSCYLEESLAGISASALVNMMNGVDLSDPNQAAVALRYNYK